MIQVGYHIIMLPQDHCMHTQLLRSVRRVGMQSATRGLLQRLQAISRSEPVRRYSDAVVFGYDGQC